MRKRFALPKQGNAGRFGLSRSSRAEGAEGAEVGAAMLFHPLAAATQVRLTQWNRGSGFADIRAAWLSRALGLGQPIRVRLAERETTGRFETIDDAGRLVLRTPSGEAEAVAAGDVFPFGQAA